MRCLIVEDQPLIRADLRAQMLDLGFLCSEADGVEAASELLKTHHFDVILLDWQIRGGTAQTLVDYLHVMDGHATVILVTGSGAFPNGENAGIAPRIDYVLRKPVNPEDLRALVEYAARRGG